LFIFKHLTTLNSFVSFTNYWLQSFLDFNCLIEDVTSELNLNCLAFLFIDLSKLSLLMSF